MKKNEKRKEPPHIIIQLMILGVLGYGVWKFTKWMDFDKRLNDWGITGYKTK